jgi:hypothetical protein
LKFLKYWNFYFNLYIFLKFWTFITPLPMVFRPPYPWYIDHLNHGILTPLPMVYRPPYPWYIDPLNHGISTPLPMVTVYWHPCLWNIDPPIYGISNPLLWYYERLSFGGNVKGGSIYLEGVQNTMTKNWPWGQNTIWKIEPGVKISYVNWPRGQFTMGFKIPYDTRMVQIKIKIR